MTAILKINPAFDVAFTCNTPPLAVVNNLVEPDWCTQIIERALPRMTANLTVDNENGGSKQDPSRTSWGTFFSFNELPLFVELEARLERLTGIPTNQGEEFQILRYHPGQQYLPHFDYFDPVYPGSAGHLQRGGQRIATVLLYLNDVEEGGSTIFPYAAGLEVRPRKGSACYFTYKCPEATSQHGGMPVVRGEKWVLTKWYRERPYR